MINLTNQIKKDLNKFCVEIGQRHPGSKGNQQAVDYLKMRFKETEWFVETPSFKCIDWKGGTVELSRGNHSFKAHVSPYSLPCDINGKVKSISTIEELEELNENSQILILHGDLCKEQLLPRNYPFYFPKLHQRIYNALERVSPKAIIAITTINPELAGAMYPFPLIEDGSFDIPSVFMTDKEGAKLLKLDHDSINLKIDSKRIFSTASNVIAKKNGPSSKKIVFCAHIDTKIYTPGALDNGTGLSTLIALADILSNYKGFHTIELVAFNGEDYYAASGELLYLKNNPNLKNEVILAVNTDGAGYKETLSGYSFYGCEGKFKEGLTNVFASNPTFTIMEPWYQSDHMIFHMNGIRSVGVTSSNFKDLWTKIAHTEKDTIDLVDSEKINEIVKVYMEVISFLSQ